VWWRVYSRRGGQAAGASAWPAHWERERSSSGCCGSTGAFLAIVVGTIMPPDVAAVGNAEGGGRPSQISTARRSLKTVPFAAVLAARRAQQEQAAAAQRRCSQQDSSCTEGCGAQASPTAATQASSGAGSAAKLLQSSHPRTVLAKLAKARKALRPRQALYLAFILVSLAQACPRERERHTLRAKCIAASIVICTY
jgi:hypothetical protein